MIEKLNNYKLVFWDFDGVIKESLEVKREAFANIFQGVDEQIKLRIKKHHDENGGMSRYEKIPIYLEFANQSKKDENIQNYLNLFSKYVKNGVINSKWCNGVKEYLNKNYNKQYFVLLTATPTIEIIEIISELKIDKYFKEVYGSPLKKYQIVNNVLKNFKFRKSEVALLGDSKNDYIAAKENDIHFYLKINQYNKKLQNEIDCFKYSEIQ